MSEEKPAEQSQHQCKLAPVPGIYTLVKVEQFKGGFRGVDGCAPVRIFACEICGHLEFFSENIIVANVQKIIAARMMAAKDNGNSSD